VKRMQATSWHCVSVFLRGAGKNTKKLSWGSQSLYTNSKTKALNTSNFIPYFLAFGVFNVNKKLR
jgi:hypothetical protein